MFTMNLRVQVGLRRSMHVRLNYTVLLFGGLHELCNGWLGQIDPPLCFFVVAVAATAADVDAAARGGLTGIAAAIQKNRLCGPKEVTQNFFLISPPFPFLYFPMSKPTLNLNSGKSGPRKIYFF